VYFFCLAFDVPALLPQAPSNRQQTASRSDTTTAPEGIRSRVDCVRCAETCISPRDGTFAADLDTPIDTDVMVSTYPECFQLF
jgi:hypothetical protein